VITVPLVSLSVAKQHLRVTDTAHDADITQKVAAAQQLIIARLAEAADATWTEATVPEPLRNAILMLTSALYELRGGEDSQDNFRKTWQAIDGLIAPYRYTTLA
jgi:hypothetical protein